MMLFEDIQRDYELRHEPEAAHRLGETAWVFILIIAVLCAVASASYGFWLYRNPPQTIAPSTTVKIDAGGFDTAQVRAIVETLETRIAEFQERVE